MNLDVAVERKIRVLETEITLAAAEQRHEDLPEVLAHLREGREEQLSRRAVDLANCLLERLARFGEVGALAGQEILTLERFLMLLDREHVHGAEALELLAQRFGFGAQRIVV